MQTRNVEINIGKICNNNCRFCMSGQDEAKKFGFVSKNTIIKELDSKAKEGYNSVGFLGGEFTLHPDVMELVNVAKQNDFKIIHIISNGRKYHNKKFLQDLVTSGANRFSVSIHSHDAKIEDYLTQRQGSFKEKLNGLINLMEFYKQGLIPNKISLNLVINKLNYNVLDKFIVFFNRLGLENFRFNYMWPEGNVFLNKKLIVRYDDLRAEMQKIIALIDKLDIDLVFEGIPPCIFAELEHDFKYRGELRDLPTTVLSLTNYDGSKKNNKEIARREFDWQKRKENSLKSKNSNCINCRLNNSCEGVWKTYTNMFGWQEFKPIN